MRQSKMKHEIVLKEEIPGQKALKLLLRKSGEQIQMLSNDATRSKPEGHVLANVHKDERKVQSFTAPTIGTSPDGQYRNQIDYVIGSRRWRSCILSAKTRPGADCDTDHELLISNIRIKLNNTKRITVPKYNVITFLMDLKST